eukprot:3827301-Rhodomonas_salina.4
MKLSAIRVCYSLFSSETADGTICLRERYAMPGTETAYGIPRSLLVPEWRQSHGTAIAYWPTHPLRTLRY